MDVIFGFLIFTAITVTGVIVPAASDGTAESVAGSVGKGLDSNSSSLLDGFETTDSIKIGDIGDDFEGFDDFAEQPDSSSEDIPEPSFTFYPPVEKSEIRSPFGYRAHPITKVKKLHEGLDLDGFTGDSILASAEGKVIFSGKKNGYGNFVEIAHPDGWTSRYAHLNSIEVDKGDQVNAKDLVGTMGESGDVTGVHLHFEIKWNDQLVDPEKVISFTPEIN